MNPFKLFYFLPFVRFWLFLATCRKRTNTNHLGSLLIEVWYTLHLTIFCSRSISSNPTSCRELSVARETAKEINLTLARTSTERVITKLGCRMHMVNMRNICLAFSENIFNYSSSLCRNLKYKSVNENLKLNSQYSDIILSAMASQITGVSIVFSIVGSDADQRNIKALRHGPLCGQFTKEQ